MIDIKKVQEEAEKEIRDEKTKLAKDKIKSKLQEKDKAKKVLKNIERELKDIYADVEGELSDGVN